MPEPTLASWIIDSCGHAEIAEGGVGIIDVLERQPSHQSLCVCPTRVRQILQLRKNFGHLPTCGRISLLDLYEEILASSNYVVYHSLFHSVS